MKPLSASPTLVEQVHAAVMGEVATGRLKPGERIIQEQIAQQLGVSRQPVQQALILLHKQGVLREAPGRGLQVAPLDLDHVEHVYAIRAAIEGMACRRAAEVGAERAARLGPAVLQAGRRAVATGSVAAMIAADLKFHGFLYELSGNPLVAPAMEAHLAYAQRVMGEVLMRDEKPRDVWDQHERILDAIVAGQGEQAEALVRRHVGEASSFMVARLRGRVSETVPR